MKDTNFLLDVAESAAEESGKRLLKFFRHPKLSISRKYDYAGSIVTNADKESERLILAKIRKSRIKSTVISEEMGRVDYGSREIVWAVDPLDGTLNFVKGIPHFAVSISVRVAGKTMVGAIYDPILDEMYTAARGLGARINGRKTQVSKTTALRNAALIFEWWDREPSIPDPLRLEGQFYRHTRSVRSPGSIALNLCSVASGRFDGLITVYQKSPIWETTAGCLIIEEAGGLVTNSLGASWETLSRSIIAGGPAFQRRLMAFVKSGGK
ncbi:MAG TPA: inositol monophosphatase family protein [Terriglobales bacterium]|nr:inositol monophosphatase family protein [Terriglobales bacterium]